MNIHSESGLSRWKDNTIVISDGTRTRVQIGKDANADYNIYVWDKAGNLMFDALGLTEKGVQREIIRNDMIKEDADISASKLDIGSLLMLLITTEVTRLNLARYMLIVINRRSMFLLRQ